MFNDTNSGAADSNPETVPARLTIPGWSRDRILRLPTHRRHKLPDAEEGLEMPGGYWVSRALLLEVFRMFWRCASDLRPARKHTARQMCSDPGWEDRPRGQRLAIGRCIKYFEVHGVLPIRLLNPDTRGTRKYLLNPDLDPSTAT